MTENHPTTPPAAEPFVILPVSVLDSGVSSKALHTYASIRRHADNTTGETWVGRELIAEHMGYSRVKSVDPHIKELVEAGLIVSVPRYVNKRDGRDWSLTRDAQHTEQGSNLYTIVDIAAGHEGGAKTPPVGAQKRPHPGRKNAHELDPFNQTHTPRDEKTSVIAGAPTPKPVDESAREERRWRAGERTAEPRPLHAEWIPNNANRAVAREVGLDADVAAEAFRRVMNAWGQKRTEWGKAFTEYVRKAAEGNAAHTFVTVEDDDVVAQVVEAAVETVRATQAPASTPVVEVVKANPWGEAESVVVDENGHAYEATLVDVVEDTPEAEVVLAGPGVAGYTPEVEHAITRAERIVRADGGDYFTRDERVRAAELAQQGVTFATIAGEIDQDRARAAVRMGGAA